MIRWRPTSLIAQTIIVLMVGLTASHLLSMVVYSGDRIAALTRQGNRAVGQRHRLSLIHISEPTRPY